jgi:hypothetical protein
MPASAPLQILIFRDPADVDVVPYEEAIVRSFQGGKDAAGYLATGEDLQIQLQIFPGAPPHSAAQLLDGFDHTLTLVLIDMEFLRTGDATLWDWLGDCWRHTDASAGRHAMLAVPMEERLGDQFGRKNDAVQSLQVRPVQELDERAIRPALLALRVLHECRLLLAAAVSTTISSGSLRGCAHRRAECLSAPTKWANGSEKNWESRIFELLNTAIFDSFQYCCLDCLSYLASIQKLRAAVVEAGRP